MRQAAEDLIRPDYAEDKNTKACALQRGRVVLCCGSRRPGAFYNEAQAAPGSWTLIVFALP